jgi:3-dehydroquinate synthase
MRAALFLSRRLHRQVNQVRAETILDALPIPPFPPDLTTGALHAAMDADKKQEAGALRFILLKKLGEAYVERDVTSPDVEAAWAYALGRPC